ncbi:MAG: response regulator, partial [Salinibacter sp.]
EEAALPDDEAPAFQSGAPSLDGTRALVVEDHETTRRLLLQLLRRWGVEGTAVAAEEEARDRLDEEAASYDVVLLDRDLLGEGETVLRDRIRALRDAEAPSVLVLGVVGENADSAEAADGAVSKPIKASSLFEAMRQALGSESEADAGSETPETEQASRRVLLAEDDTVNQRMMVQVLSTMGHEADVVDTGTKALDALRADSYDVVLMDVQMPEM